jgi:hypothetical protein
VTLVTGESYFRKERYKFNQLSLDLPTNDTDISIRFPNGRTMALQWRVEYGSIDICLPENLGVTNWKIGKAISNRFRRGVPR